ncbi:MAG: hypothetical protein K0S07_1210 [Chlamydiales bacterium]|jgi:hypothetical protein|nr:hypothetical protein [Chlamydiales bacterium]
MTQRILFPLLAAFALTGCHPCPKALLHHQKQDLYVASSYTNFQYPIQNLKNVLLLPIDNPLQDPAIEMHREEISLSLLRNFSKKHLFNLQFDAKLAIPKGPVVNLDTHAVDRFQLGAIGENYHADAALQVSIIDYLPYAPMRMKVKAMLVDTKTSETIWAFDHVFDTDQSATLLLLEDWWKSEMKKGDRRNHFDLATVRPSLFASFVFDCVAKSFFYGHEQRQDLLFIQ